jgi:protein SERAC1
MNIDHHSTSLILKLGNYRRDTGTVCSSTLSQSYVGVPANTGTGKSTRPIIFVAHSLGGLVCANALASHHGSDDQGQQLVDNTCGTIFLGTPFKGSDKAAWATMAERVLRMFGDSNDQTIKHLDERSEKLQQISIDFHMLLQKRYASKELKPIQVACFFEEMNTTKNWWKVKKDLGQIVTDKSATLAGYKPIGINANHIAMCKFPALQTQGYIDVTGKMKLMISNLDKPTEEMNVRPLHCCQGTYNAS